MDQIEGRNPVVEALKANREMEKLCIAKGSKGQVISEIAELCARASIPVKWLDKKEIQQLAVTGGHQGIIAFAKPVAYAAIEEVMGSINAEEDPIFLLLDHLQDPQNFGAILRTAEAAGVKALIIPNRRAVGMTPAVLKVAAGAVEHVPVVAVTNLARTIDQLKDQGFWVMGAQAGAAQSIYQTDMRMPLVLAIGSEGKGLSRLVKEKCDFLVSIPLMGKLNSLNAASAAAVVIFEALRQRLDG
ncbi:23S rRNA (guanosine(2251)-2'-O)-methyltransferase RlmB [Metallumcola ferriviriculae]|uniref:23S rRNA (Guanosine(2251)-2'-O)-methyltransferase RlmB n=1 Tax=Metallumcola ferriviriculae TaxID=3039180 RepID=A0AAU0UJR1_9FIRM|nr:23S rRNA (guanosine(2251)-2'-O)-methyltransferase RlmB [Desulfitibacteraceae bacterium MK1]